jgi:ligand-binding sensor domain-containing protein
LGVFVKQFSKSWIYWVSIRGMKKLLIFFSMTILFALSLAVISSSASSIAQQTLIDHWEKAGVGLEDATVSSLVFDKLGNLYAGLAKYNTDAVFVLPKGSKTWRSFSDGLPTIGKVGLYRDPAGDVYCNTEEAGLFAIKQGQLAWSQADHVKDGYPPIKLAQFGDVTILDRRNGFANEYRISVLLGANESIAREQRNGPAANFAVSKKGLLYFSFGTEIQRSADSLVSIANSNNEFYFTQVGESLPAKITAFVLTPSDTLYVAYNSDSVSGVAKLSATNGSWVDITANLPKSTGYQLGVDTTGTLVATTESAGVFVLPVGLTTWLPLATSSLTGSGQSVFSLAIDEEQGIFIGTKAGVYRGTRGRL